MGSFKRDHLLLLLLSLSSSCSCFLLCCPSSINGGGVWDLEVEEDAEVGEEEEEVIREVGDGGRSDRKLEAIRVGEEEGGATSVGGECGVATKISEGDERED